MMRYILSLVAALAAALSAPAAIGDTTAVRPVLSAYSFEAGSAHLRDSYLTAVPYSGWTAALDYERLQVAPRGHRRWLMRLDARLDFGRADNIAGNAAMWTLGISPSWALLRRFNPAPALTLALGGIARADLGLSYLMRNSNNPVSVNAAITIGATALAAWRTSLARIPVTLRYQASMPLTGAFFAPDYDQLYYEIWLGNHSHLAHWAWPGSYFALDNLITADIALGSSSLRLGYRCYFLSWSAANIVTRRITHSFILGFTTEWLSLSPRRSRLADAAIISSFY